MSDINNNHENTENNSVIDTAENDVSGLQENITISEQEVPRKKRKITIITFIIILLSAALILLCLSMYAYKHREEIKESMKPSVQIQNTSAQTPVPTALPEELTTNSSLTVLVDKTHTLPADYVPDNLDTPYLVSTTEVIQVNAEAGAAAKEMMSAASEAGITLYVTSGYVSYADQEILYQSYVSLLGDGAEQACPKAGSSEHQTGLALDFTDDSTVSRQTVDFGETDAGKWLYEHAHEYGFILRYPQGKESITGYSYMPYHFRYVGKEIASAMYEISPDETFEEYFGISSK